MASEKEENENRNLGKESDKDLDELGVNKVLQGMKVVILWLILSVPVPLIVFFFDLITSGMISGLFLKTALSIASSYPKIRNYVPLLVKYDLEYLTSRSFIISRGMEKVGIDPASINLVLHLGILLLTFLLVVIFTYLLSPRILRRWYKAKKLKESEFPEFHKLVAELSERYRMKRPEIFIGEFSPNVFIVGRKPSIVVSNRVFDILNEGELEAVIAFQMLNMKRGTIVMTIAAFVAGLLTSLSTLAYWISLLTGFGLEDDPAPNLIKLYVMSLVAPLSALIVRFMMPYRKTRVFSTFLNSYKDPEKLVNAIDKIKKHNGEFSLPDLSSQPINPGHWHLFLVTPEHKEVVNILDFHIPTYLSFFTDGKPKRLRPVLYTTVSHFFVLFAIIAFDTFNRKDFDFLRAGAISIVYLFFYLIFMLIWLVAFRK